MAQYDLSDKPPVQVLLELSSSDTLHEGDLDDALQEVAAGATRVLRVAMAAIWIRPHPGAPLACRALAGPSSLGFVAGTVILDEAAPAFARLQAELHDALPVHDVRLYPALRDLGTLLGAADVRSLLEVPLRLHGSNVGVVSFGELGQRRNWTRDDVLFGSHIAHVVSQMLGDRAHREHQRQLAEANRGLEQRVAERTQELQDALRALEESSLTDPLTGLRNRRFLMQQLEVDAALSVRKYESHGRPRVTNDADLTIFMVDIDHFKQVNDTHGHPAGDALLVQMKARLQRVFRESDYLVRWGGEEFLIVARSTAREHADDLAERVRSTIAEQPFELPGGVAIAKTCSIGFASHPFAVSDPRRIGWQDVVAIADMGLYAAKRAGRNGWVGLKATEPANAETLLAALRPSPRAALADALVTVSTSLDAARVADAW